ncbi:hypothetical protein EDD98_5709 [Streptomyces sp. PanSC19]|uniref:hypothetical protein n=1 Tax=Streptomyces sp. PanSC19 TaxID=1520455 RepID=UPI000F4A273B|nr:hypothetical protein [Streptomyces sp. PanSC19]ROQ26107.1 hypothetical protein EDD98_5709 [Streptomyces sp. PanSC19]
MTVTLTPVRPVTPLTELESTVPGAPDEEEGAVTGLRLICTGRELQEITVITDGEDVPYRTDLTFSCPTWLPTAVAEHQLPIPEEERCRIANIPARAYDGRCLDELREEHAAFHIAAADAVLTTRQAPSRPSPPVRLLRPRLLFESPCGVRRVSPVL